jgi:hypothetical protein
MNAESGTEVVTTEVVEAEKPVTDATTENTETVEQKAERERDEAGKFRKPVQPRIDELTRKHREQERETAYWKAQALQRQERDQAEATAKAAEKPTPDKYGTYDEYVEALTDWKADKKIDDKLGERDKANAEKSAAEKRQQAWRERTEKAVKEMPDYDAVIEAAADTPVAQHLREILDDSDYGARLLYHFAKNPDVIERLNDMKPSAAAREVGRIEASFDRPATPDPEPEAAVEAEPEAPLARRTKAPAPAKPVGSGRSVAVDLGKAPMDEYIAARSKQGARWARR